MREENYNVELTGFPPSLDNNKCYDCGALKQDGYLEKFVEHCGEPMSVFVCDTCFNKPTLICPICKWVGNASMKRITDTTADHGYCPKCKGTKCLKFDD